jgi:hypothetical protein
MESPPPELYSRGMEYSLDSLLPPSEVPIDFRLPLDMKKRRTRFMTILRFQRLRTYQTRCIGCCGEHDAGSLTEEVSSSQVENYTTVSQGILVLVDHSSSDFIPTRSGMPCDEFVPTSSVLCRIRRYIVSPQFQLTT